MEPDFILHKAENLHINMLALSLYDNGQISTWHKENTHWRNNVYSVTKSVTALVVGILQERHLMDPFQDTVRDCLGEEIPPTLRTVWDKVKLYHLLTHTTGFDHDCLDIDNNDASQWGMTDYLGRVLQCPLVHTPGSKMVYCDGNYYLLSRCITARTGKTLQEWAQREIFKPLGIVGVAWSVCPDNYAIGATGLFLTVEDMLKLGVMLLQHGAYQGHQIVSPEWIAEVTKKRVSTDRVDRDWYGLGFWVRSDTTAFMANGMLGQLIYVSPKTNRVVAWQSCDNGSGIGLLTDFLVDRDV